MTSRQNRPRPDRRAGRVSAQLWQLPVNGDQGDPHAAAKLHLIAELRAALNIENLDEVQRLLNQWYKMQSAKS